MKRSSVVLGVCAIGLLVTASIGVFLSFQLMQNQPPDFQWAVSINDEFMYTLIIHGENTTFEYVPENESYIYYDSPLSIGVMNESTIVAKTINLPVISDDVTMSSFGELVRADKVDCRFINGSEIQLEHKTWLNLLVSTSLLPIGGWSVLDSLCPGPPGYVATTGNNQYTRAYDNYFLIIDAWGGVEMGYWAQGNVSLDNGVPVEGYLKYASYITYDAPVTYSMYHFEIEIALLSD